VNDGRRQGWCSLPISASSPTRRHPEDVQAGVRTGGGRDGWTPPELRTSFVSLMSHYGVSIEEIARLVGHAYTRITEVVYRKELRQVITTGAEIMDEIFVGG
jgi:integrase